MGILGFLCRRFAAMLEPAERDAVLGDLRELGIGGVEALWSLLGLVVRRQASGWPLSLGLALPAGLLLGPMSLSACDRLTRHVWTYWKFGVRLETGLTAGEDALAIVCKLAAVVWWSWIAGFALGLASRRAIWLNVSTLCAAGLSTGGILIFVPAACGARLAARRGSLGACTALAITSVTVAITMLAYWTGGWWEVAFVNWSQQR